MSVFLTGITAGSGVASQNQNQDPKGAAGVQVGLSGSSVNSAGAGEPSISAASQTGGSSPAAVKELSAAPAEPAGLGGSVQTANGESTAADWSIPSETAVHQHGNGQKLMNGGVENSHTGILGTFGGGTSHFDYIGTTDPSNHDLAIGMIDHTASPAQPEATVMSSAATAASIADSGSFSSSSALTPGPGDLLHHLDVSINQSEPNLASLDTESDQSLSSAVSGSSLSAAHGVATADLSNSEAQTDGADSADVNGNGRQTLLTDIKGVCKTAGPLKDSHVSTHPTRRLGFWT
ncbi:hypothetical protein LDENG_00164090 [Lucifuga dentata]|nr:hypothetical protein LDENG_00164090 [Lucifuga dentata]